MQYPISERMRQMQPSAIREILKLATNPGVISFAAGNPAPEAFPTGDIARITADILADNPIGALQYSVSEGYPPLREALQDFLLETYNIRKEGNELLVVSGAQQAMDFACKVLCDEGDVIITEEPTFLGALHTFRSYRLNIIGVAMEDDGISLEGLERALQENRGKVRFIYLIPTFQNPTGLTMSLAKRHACYQLAEKYGVVILEDNPYGELRFAGADIPPIKSFDTAGLVLYIGTFSKILAPGIRVGFVYGPKDITNRIVVAKQCSDVHTNVLSQILCHRFMTEGDFPGHLEFLRQVYRKKSGLMLQHLDATVQGVVSYTRPEGGLFIWCQLPDAWDMPTFVHTLLDANLAVVPGNAFMINSDAPAKTFRLNYSTPSDEQLVEGVGILASVVAKGHG